MDGLTMVEYIRLWVGRTQMGLVAASTRIKPDVLPPPRVEATGRKGGPDAF